MLPSTIVDSPRQVRGYTLNTPNLIIEGVPVNPFYYDPDDSYSIETLDAIHDWLKTHSLEIDGTPVNGFERDSKGRLVAVPPAPLGKEVGVAQIITQLSIWNSFSAQPGAVTSSQGGFLIGPGTIKAPDVAFTPSGICSVLTHDQQSTFQGAPFCPTFVVELDDLTKAQKLKDLTEKIKDSYFSSGAQLAWLVDPVHKIFYEFKRTNTGVIRRSPLLWYKKDKKTKKNQPAVINGGEVLPGFELELSGLDKVYTVFQQNAPAAGPNLQFTCSQCNQPFTRYGLVRHLQTSH